MRIRQISIAMIAILMLSSLGLLFLPHEALAQASVLKCGDIIKGRFVKNAQQDKYTIDVGDNDKLKILAKASGDTLKFFLGLYDPVGRTTFGISQPQPDLVYTSPALSGGGTYTIIIQNSYNDGTPLGLGFYTISIGCTIAATGKDIEPGQSLPADTAPQPTKPAPGPKAPTPTPASIAAAPTPAPAPAPAFSGVGFPGLPAVDFSKGFKVALSTTVPFTGTLTPGAGDVLSLTFDGKANDLVALDFNRLSGNLNLGVAILAPDNTLLFHATLLASDLVSTRLKLPAAGKYVVGVFRVGINEPRQPAETPFRVQVRINPR